MTDPTATELRFRRTENDMLAVHDMLSEISAIQKEHGTRLDGIDTKLDSILEKVSDSRSS